MNLYNADWNTIDSFSNYGYYKTALEKSEVLFEKIKKNKNNKAYDDQYIKAIIYINKYQSQLEERGLAQSIARMEKELEAANNPAKSIFHSLLADMYNQYISNHIYKIRDRTHTPEYKTDDISTWSTRDLTNKIFEHLSASVQYDQLQKIPITDFPSLISSGNFDANTYRSTLYDVLVHKALDYFSNEQYYLAQPIYQFYIDQEQALGDTEAFLAFDFKAKDTLSSKYQALLLFQGALNFHKEDANPSALLDLELKRLRFVYNNTILSNKDVLYIATLENWIKKYKKYPISTEAQYWLASHYYEKGNSYQPNPDELNRWELKKAHEICTEAAKQHPKSLGAMNCRSIKDYIESKSINFSVEQFSAPNQPLLVGLEYKNVEKVYARLIKISPEQQTKISSLDYDRFLKYVKSLKPVETWSNTLEDEGDFQNHRTEIKINPQKKGTYLLIFSNDKRFSNKKNGITYQFFTITDLAFIHQNQNQEFYEIFVMNRTTGAPIKGAKVEFFEQHYNSLLRRYENRKVGEFKTNEEGFVSTKKVRSSNYFEAIITHNGDKLSTNSSFYNGTRSKAYQGYDTHFFLDRAIYRPGQTVYFKGLILKPNAIDNRLPEIKANHKTEIVFYDANGQEVSRQAVTSNEYGTFNGSFTAPSSGMLGQMLIKDKYSNDYKYFRVEEYKRPKFEVSFKPLEGSFKLDETASVTCKATAFAGNAIDGAKVKYRVVRKAIFPYWSYWRWGWYNPYSEKTQEIVFGETTTNEKGECRIEFKAMPDRSIPKDKKPQFQYTVYADVTDITGETHSTQIVVNVGYIALQASIDVPENVDKTEVEFFKISTQNLNGVFEPASGTIKIEQLEKPTVSYINRFWEKPDFYTIDEQEFKANFPNLPYGDEDKIENWKTLKTTLDTKFDTKTAKQLDLALNNWEQGAYKVTLQTQDKYGSAIEVVKYFTLFDPKGKQVPLAEALYAPDMYQEITPGKKASFNIGSFNKNAYILYQIEWDGKVVDRKWLNSDKRETITFDIEEKHRGNIYINLLTVQNGRLYQQSGTVNVPWDNKDLKIEYSTFRDKLLPGAKEEWSIKISGNKGDKVAAEMLAGMYDASLDAFAANSWNFNVFPTNNRFIYPSGSCFSYNNSYTINYNWFSYSYGNTRMYPAIQWFGFSFYDYGYSGYYNGSPAGLQLSSMEVATVSVRGASKNKSKKSKKESGRLLGVNEKEMAMEDALSPAPDPQMALAQEFEQEDLEEQGDFGDVKIRTNLNETVFFFPDLHTDEEGNIIIKFTMNEALTRWKFMTFAHTKDLQSITSTREVVTQKDLMILPNAPRFFRQGDQIEFTAKVSNMTDKAMEGQATLQLFDALTMKPIDAAFGNSSSVSNFKVEGKLSAPLSWKLNIPSNWVNPITYRVIAKAGSFSDGEENALPVLSNKMLITETMPLPVRGGQTKTFDFKRMTEVSKSPTMQQHQLMLEFTPNPAWYAIQALPYMMEYPYECTEQIFSRYYANSLASGVANSHPKIKRVFEQWRDIDPNALKSNLAKNEALKYALLEETPWVMAAQSEEAQKRHLGILFDLNRMGNELAQARDKMAKRQLANGGFSWFPGGRDSWYITQYIVEGMGHLDVLKVKDVREDKTTVRMLEKAVTYIDGELTRDYRELKKWAKKQKGMSVEEYMALDHLSYMAIHYLYARSFFLDWEITNEQTKEAVAYYEGQAQKYWMKRSDYMQGLLALAIHRKGKDAQTPKDIVRSLKERSLNSEEMGMYWKYPSGYYWYQLPIETHSLMIEVFSEVAKDEKAVDDLKTWLLKAKQTTHWKTTKATAAACYALLSNGDNWILEDKDVDITLGSTKLDQSSIKKEAGTGYFKKTWTNDEIKPEMAKVTITNPNKVVSWGALYWQYFEELDKITHFQETPLKLTKKLFKEVNTDRGPVLEEIKEGYKLVPGDLIKVRIELHVDRDMEYVHMKDMRASGLEPVNVLSQYKYQGGLGYYESTRDAATNFFFSYLSKGDYIFEYPLRVNHKGDFSNGVTTIQCMYAPEFTAHSEGVRIKID